MENIGIVIFSANESHIEVPIGDFFFIQLQASYCLLSPSKIGVFLNIKNTLKTSKDIPTLV